MANYELRTLTAKDMFPMFKIISAIGVKEFRTCFESEDVRRAIASAQENGASVDLSAVGMMIMLDVAGIVISRLPACEADIYTFLANISNLSKKEIEQLDIVTFTEMVVDVIKKPEFKDFIGVASKLFK